jgi:mannose-6-phosphate isomerase-like protein (cupin superfamily)
MSLGALVEAPVQGATIEVVRHDATQAIFRDDAECRIRTLSPLECEKDVEFYHLTLKPRGVLDSAPHFSGTREFITVNSGTIAVHSGETQERLDPGDSAHYPADVPHRIVNAGDGEAARRRRCRGYVHRDSAFGLPLNNPVWAACG